ncbi:hypothetical protein JOD55_000220 [Arcanobacterium pluranimalium]|uniref:hypothetical protein n=1 Tax=Arcanobacterium pluranimalium TaxID=108028 RepID=UPI00195699A5|nr:hypothetical protein [Arcanobacterium pluranimalium]MBM7824393.1 hypothetical protein [Arcanobacterium pluranimalium]
MKSPKTISLALSVILCFFASSCSLGGEENKSSSPPNELNLKPDINHDTLTITLPSDRYTFNLADQQILLSAGSAAMAKCAREKLGIPWVGWTPDRVGNGKLLAFSQFGPWTKAMAEKNAFGNPDLKSTPPKQMPTNHPAAINSQVPDNQKDKMVETCRPEPEVSQFDLDTVAQKGPWIDEISNTYSEVKKDERAQQVFSEIASCYESKGLKMSQDSPGYVEGFTSDDRTPEAFTAAIKAAQCQEELNATPRLVEIWANLQAPIITKYADELIAQRKHIDDAVTNAKEYINTHPELFKPMK